MTDKQVNPYETSFVEGDVSICGDSQSTACSTIDEPSAILPVPAPAYVRSQQRQQPMTPPVQVLRSISQIQMPPPATVPPYTSSVNPYETSLGRGNVSISGDTTVGRGGFQGESMITAPSPIRPLSKPSTPPPANLNSSTVDQPTIDTLNSTLIIPPRPQTVQEMMRRFHRPFITTEGWNLDEYRDEALPEPKDPTYRVTKRAILTHRDQMREKFAKMQSANNIPGVIYFEQPLDPKCFFNSFSSSPNDGTTTNSQDETRKRKAGHSDQSFREFLNEKKRSETLEAANSGKPSKGIFANSTFASIFEKYKSATNLSNNNHFSNSRNKENTSNNGYLPASNGLGPYLPKYPQPQKPRPRVSQQQPKMATNTYHAKHNSQPGPSQNQRRLSQPKPQPNLPSNPDLVRESQRVKYAQSSMYHFLYNDGAAPPVDELNLTLQEQQQQQQQQLKYQMEQLQKSQEQSKRRRVNFDDSRHRALTFGDQVGRSIDQDIATQQQRKMLPPNSDFINEEEDDEYQERPEVTFHLDLDRTAFQSQPEEPQMVQEEINGSFALNHFNNTKNTKNTKNNREIQNQNPNHFNNNNREIQNQNPNHDATFLSESRRSYLSIVSRARAIEASISRVDGNEDPGDLANTTSRSHSLNLTMDMSRYRFYKL